jgi:hypothetical protein
LEAPPLVNLLKFLILNYQIFMVFSSLQGVD